MNDAVEQSEGQSWRWPLIVGIALSIPILFSGLFLDDWIFLKSLRSPLQSQAPYWDLYRFIPADAAELAVWRDEGIVPWWTHEHFRLAFFRPLSSLLMVADWQLFGEHWWGYHLHTLLWHTLYLWVGLRLIRRMSEPGPWRRLAYWLFCLEDCHFAIAGWWSNRHALVAATLTLGAFELYLRWREDQWQPGRWLSLLLFVLGLFAGEMSFSIAAFFGSYALFSPRGVWSEIKAQALHVMFFIAFLGLYSSLNRGAQHSAFYIDPIHQPAAFAQALPARMLMLWGDLFTQLPSDVGILGGPPYWVLTIIGLIVFVISVVLLRNLPRRFRWTVVAAFVCLIPAAGAPATGRQLLMACICGSALLSYLLNALKESRASWLYRPALVWSLLTPIALGTFFFYGQMATEQAAVETAAQLAQCDDARRTWILNAPDHITGFYLPLYQEQALHREPNRTVALSMTHTEMRYRFEATHLTLESEIPYLSSVVERFWNDAPQAAPQTQFDYRIRPEGRQLHVHSEALRQTHDLCVLIWHEGRLQPADRSPGWHEVPWSAGPAGF